MVARFNANFERRTAPVSHYLGNYADHSTTWGTIEAGNKWRPPYRVLLLYVGMSVPVQANSIRYHQPPFPRLSIYTGLWIIREIKSRRRRMRYPEGLGPGRTCATVHPPRISPSETGAIDPRTDAPKKIPARFSIQLRVTSFLFLLIHLC